MRPVRTDRSDANTALLLDDTGTVPVSQPDAPGLVDAAVLVPLVFHDTGGPTVLLTQRTAHLAHHPGQISFPGGRLETCDEDIVSCALRETEEEIGLRPEQVEILGRLDLYVTITGFRVTPIVGVARPPLVFQPDPFEVADVFEVPLAFVLNPANHQRHFRIMPSGQKRHYYAIPFGDRYIWGATAGMLVNLSEVLGGSCVS